LPRSTIGEHVANVIKPSIFFRVSNLDVKRILFVHQQGHVFVRVSAATAAWDTFDVID
jgi:hypothetical protein